MKKIIILALCAASFAVAEPKKCVTFADTAGEGCIVRDTSSCNFFSFAPDNSVRICGIYELKGEQVKVLCKNNCGRMVE